MKTLSFADALRPEVGGGDRGDNEGQWERFWLEARGELPIAIAEKVDDDPNHNTSTSSPTITPEVNAENGSNDDEQSSSPRIEGCFYIEGLIGCVFAISVGLGVFFTELVGAIIYMFAVGFYKVAKHPNTPIFFKALFQLITQIFMVVDSVLLLCSVLISEILGFVVGIVLFIICAFSTKDPYNRSIEWAIYIRTFAHLVRQTFRTFHHGWEPDRKFPIGQGNDDNDSEEQKQQDTTHVNSQNGKQQDTDVVCEPTVIETSATFVIEPLDDEDGIEEGKGEDDYVALKKRKEGKSATSPSSSFRSLGSNSTASSIPPPPPGNAFSPSNSNSHPAETSTPHAPSVNVMEEGNDATNLPSSYVMEDDENDMV